MLWTNQVNGLTCLSLVFHLTTRKPFKVIIEQLSSSVPFQTQEEVQSLLLPLPALHLSFFISLQLQVFPNVWFVVIACVCTHEWLTTDFNYGANIQFKDITLSHICTVCHDGCWLAGNKHLLCITSIMFYTFIYNFALHEVKSPTMWLISRLSDCGWLTSVMYVTVSVALKYFSRRPLIM